MKKQETNNKKKKKLNNSLFLAILFRTFAIILLITPMVILGVCKKDVWFIQGADKVSIGFIIALIFALLMLKGAFKSLDKRVMPIITLCVLSVIVWLMDTIVNDLFWILLCSLIGYVLYMGVDSVGLYYWNIAKEYKGEKIRAVARKDFEEETKGGGMV